VRAIWRKLDPVLVSPNRAIVAVARLRIERTALRGQPPKTASGRFGTGELLDARRRLMREADGHRTLP
jgi:hypothetical protein